MYTHTRLHLVIHIYGICHLHGALHTACNTIGSVQQQQLPLKASGVTRQAAATAARGEGGAAAASTAAAVIRQLVCLPYPATSYLLPSSPCHLELSVPQFLSLSTLVLCRLLTFAHLCNAP